MVHRLRRLAAFGTVAAAGVCLPFAGASAGAVTVPSHNLSNRAVLAFIRSTLKDVKIGSPARGVHEITSGGATITKVTSLNWSGYAATGATATTFTSVHGSWKEPTVTCPANGSGLSLAAFWVGIDGFSSKTVEQDGTIGECFGSTLIGTADWWEMYPSNAVQVVNTIAAGDSIVASVVDKAGQYTLKVTDKTNTAASFTQTQSCGTTACSNSSAEWIAEAPCCSAPSTVYPLAQFTPWRVFGGHAGSAGVSRAIGKYAGDEITMVNSSKAPLATPTALNKKGTSFAVKWNANS